MPQIFEISPETVQQAADALHRGELVACPTDTVFGLVADATNSAAVAAIFAAKGRGADTPLPVMIADLAQAEAIAVFSDAALRLSDAFWPGALTIVLPLRDDAGLAQAVTAGMATVALRVPGHPVTLYLLKTFGGSLAVTSANVSGQASALTADEVTASLGENVALILDGNTASGHSPSGTESTIVAVEESRIRVLRQGDVSAEDLARISGLPLAENE